MKEIDINKALFDVLKKDYENHKQDKLYQSQLQSGFDYLEALIKFFASINISIVKDIDNDIYKDIFIKNFKLAPSLGDFKSLATVVFSKKNKNKLITQNEIYDLLYEIFNTRISIGLVDATSILDDDKKVKNFNTIIKLLNEYVVSFRNKIKGHGASFKDDDLSLRNTILENLDKVLTQLNQTYADILTNILFYTVDSNIVIKYKDTICTLLPIVSYIECDKYSCSKNHKNKLFFYNDGQESKSHYIDYSFNHYFQITQQNEIHQNLKQLQDEVLHSTSDSFRQSILLSNFVGREQELLSVKTHILSNITNNQSSFISLVGKPGIGKSAFLTQLQHILTQDESLKDSINSYTFYTQKNSMDVEEDKYLYKKITAYIDTLGISSKQDGDFNMTSYLENLFTVYENDKDTKPLILIIDGLDEFSNPSDIIKKFPLNFKNKIHIIFSSRSYSNITSTIASKLANKTEQLNMLNEQNIIKNGYSFELGKLSFNEVEQLLSSVISKEINRDTKEYKDIVDTIATQSESLPLYIYYITQELKEKNIIDDNITDTIISWAKKLPPKLENFYQDIFKNISPLARKILLILYFSRSGINKKDLYQILKKISSNNFTTLDKTAFEVEIFNSIEVFLKLNDDNTYSFYHLSVKEAIQEYLKDQDELATLDLDKLKEDEILVDEMVNQNQEYIQNMVYLDKQSDSYEFLQTLINHLKENNSLKYYKDNFFHLYNSFIWFNIFYHQISFEDMQDKNYKSILTTTKISQQNHTQIDEFFKLFDTKENKHLFEIRYAYELAFIKEDYTKVLEYKDMYENYIHELFFDICLNIDKDEYIQKFIECKDEWEQISYNAQIFFINMINSKSFLNDSFYEVIKIVGFDYFIHDQRIKLLNKVSLSILDKVINKIDNPYIVLDIYTTLLSTNHNFIDNIFSLINSSNVNRNNFIELSKIDYKRTCLFIEQNILDKKLKMTILSKIYLHQGISCLENIMGIEDEHIRYTTLSSLALKIAKSDHNIALKILDTIPYYQCKRELDAINTLENTDIVQYIDLILKEDYLLYLEYKKELAQIDKSDEDYLYYEYQSARKMNDHTLSNIINLLKDTTFQKTIHDIFKLIRTNNIILDTSIIFSKIQEKAIQLLNIKSYIELLQIIQISYLDKIRFLLNKTSTLSVELDFEVAFKYLIIFKQENVKNNILNDYMKKEINLDHALHLAKEFKNNINIKRNTLDELCINLSKQDIKQSFKFIKEFNLNEDVFINILIDYTYSNKSIELINNIVEKIKDQRIKEKLEIELLIISRQFQEAIDKLDSLVSINIEENYDDSTYKVNKLMDIFISCCKYNIDLAYNLIISNLYKFNGYPSDKKIIEVAYYFYNIDYELTKKFLNLICDEHASYTKYMFALKINDESNELKYKNFFDNHSELYLITTFLCVEIKFNPNNAFKMIIENIDALEEYIFDIDEICVFINKYLLNNYDENQLYNFIFSLKIKELQMKLCSCPREFNLLHNNIYNHSILEIETIKIIESYDYQAIIKYYNFYNI